MMLGTIEERDARIVDMVHAGVSKQAIADQLGVSASVVQKAAPTYIPSRTLADLIAAAAIITNISVKDIVGPARFRHIVRVRQAVMYLAWSDGHSSPSIGRRMGGRDHSTVIYSKQIVPTLMEQDADYRKLVDRIDAAVPRRWETSMPRPRCAA